MVEKILVVNRGEITRRIMRTAKRMGLETVAVYSEADAQAPHVLEADHAYLLGPAPASESYLNVPRILEVIEEAKIDFVHPGYGFLSENSAFVAELEARNVGFIGPKRKAIEAMGDKITARGVATNAGVSVVPGVGSAAKDADEASTMAADIGFPVMLKATAGGGGKGMRVVERPEDIAEAFAMASSEASRSFGDGRMFVEKFIVEPRHIEVQVLADQHGNVVALGERECSLQRRHQKVIEEAPSAFLRADVRAELLEQSCMLAKAVGYVSAGTVEFIVDAEQNFYFLEMNTRLQVEHPVTEMVHGNIDLVEWMIRIARGEKLDPSLGAIQVQGHAIEARLYAENPEAGFMPSAGRLHRYLPPEPSADIRLDDGVVQGSMIPMHYDPMIGKLVAYGANRDEALARLKTALAQFQIRGCANNLLFLEHLLNRPEVASGQMHTKMLDDLYPAEGDFVTPEDTLAYVGLCALAMISDEAHISNILHQDDILSGCGLIGFVVDGDSWAEYSLEIASEGDSLAILLGDGRRWVMQSGGYHHRGARVALIDDSTETLHDIRFERTELVGGYQAEWRGQRIEAVVVPERLSSFQRRMPVPTDAADEPFLSLAMAGTLLKLHVQAGDEIKIGQPLAVVEAMKMENQLLATKNTTVASIEAAIGDSLSAGTVLMHYAD